MRATRSMYRRYESGRRASRQTVLALVLFAAGLTASFAGAAPQQPFAEPAGPYVAPNKASFRVFGSREGLVGSTTASGHRILPNDRFVALPSAAVLGKKVKLAYKGKSVTVPVLDVGPYNTKDDYWNPPDTRFFKGLPQGVPQAQLAYKEGHNGGKSGIGITVDAPFGVDIGDGSFADLGMRESDWLEITFLWLLGEDDDDTGSVAAQSVAVAPTAAPTATTTATTAPTRTASASVVRGSAVSGSAVAASVQASAVAPSAAAPSVVVATAGAKATPTPTQKRGTFDPKTLPVLTGAARPPLDAAAPLGGDYTFVDETKHNIPAPIARYWKAKGGIAAFGFPVTEVFARNAEGEQHIYQYFERVLVEYLPDSDSATLAPLGGWFEEVNGPYKTIAAFESSATKRYVASTGHSIAGDILKYYATNGDSDFFGAPLNEATELRTADGRTVTAQLFERARIEVDSKGTVTLGRLGAEWLAQRGWK